MQAATVSLVMIDHGAEDPLCEWLRVISIAQALNKLEWNLLDEYKSVNYCWELPGNLYVHSRLETMA